MNLSLDHTQRLNIISMLDRLECPGRREAWAVCALQSKLDLSDEERAAIGYQKQRAPDGREYVLWSNNASVPIQTFELDEGEVARISNAMDKYPVILARDRSWWEPLNAQMPEPAESNGHAPVTQAALARSNGDKLP